MNGIRIITSLISISFIIIGADKFLHFIEPPCSLMSAIHPIIWKSIGIVQIIAGVLIWAPKYERFIVGFFCVFKGVFSLVHLSLGTYDVAGSLFLFALLAVLIWKPEVLKKPLFT